MATKSRKLIRLSQDGLVAKSLLYPLLKEFQVVSVELLALDEVDHLVVDQLLSLEILGIGYMLFVELLQEHVLNVVLVGHRGN